MIELPLHKEMFVAVVVPGNVDLRLHVVTFTAAADACLDCGRTG